MRIAGLFAFLMALLLAGVAHAQIVADTQTGADAQVSAEPAATIPVGEPDLSNILYLDLSSGGRVTIRLYPTIAPVHVDRIKTLARQGFYDGVKFHRVIEGFMAQTGDPTGTGTGGSELADLTQEFNKLPHLRGTLSMARAAGEDSANSQFFIVFQPNFKLDNKYTVFGRVTAGMEFVDGVARGEPPADPDVILQASLGDAPRPEPDYASAKARLTSANDAATPALTVGDLNAPIQPEVPTPQTAPTP